MQGYRNARVPYLYQLRHHELVWALQVMQMQTDLRALVHQARGGEQAVQRQLGPLDQHGPAQRVLLLQPLVHLLQQLHLQDHVFDWP